MAVYTEPTDEELARLLAGWGLSAPLAFKGIAEGVENSNFFLQTAEGRYILTIYEKRVEQSDLPFFLGVTSAVADSGLPAARPVMPLDGTLTQDLNCKAVALVSFLDGVSAKRPNAAQTRAVGEALARMHLALSGSELTRKNDLGPADWPALWAPLLAAAEQLEAGSAALINEDCAAIAKGWPVALPSGIIHADLFPDNVLFVGNQVTGLIDFYFACSDFLAYDLAVMLNAWCFEPMGREFNMVLGQALLRGYQSVRPLMAPEIVALPLLARGAALRFYLTRLSDWIRPTDGALVRKKDPRDYSARLAFHRAVTSARDYGLEI